MRRSFLPLILAVQAPLFSQIGYPGGYPGQYPGGQRVPGIPLPFPVPGGGGQRGGGRGTSTETATTEHGKLRRLDNQTVEIETPDHRTVDFRRTGRTRFYRDGKEIKASELKIGDNVSVEGSQDQNGNLYARNVALEPASESPETSEPAASTAPATRDADDPGPPVLRRGAPAKRETAEVETAPVRAAPATDPYIDKARATAFAFEQKVPDFVCQEYMTRYESNARPASWNALDVVSAEVVFEDGHERYRNVAVNDKPAHKDMEQLDGSWSTGEFASVLLDLFSSSTAAEFRFAKQSISAGVEARVYDFEVAQPNSHWHVRTPSQSLDPAYRGSVWIEPETGRVLRIEMQARSLPREFPLDTVEMAVDYENVRIGTGQFLLPVHAENLSCQRGTSNCGRSAIDFRNYHKYEANSTIEYDTAGVSDKVPEEKKLP